MSLECSAGYDGGLKQYFVAILCPYTTFTEVLDSQESSSNLVNLEKLNCEREIASQRNFNGPAFTFDHLPHGSPFSLAIFAQNIKVRKESRKINGGKAFKRSLQAQVLIVAVEYIFGPFGLNRCSFYKSCRCRIGPSSSSFLSFVCSSQPSSNCEKVQKLQKRRFLLSNEGRERRVH